ncbi:MAG: hypothetical protein LQ351_005393 [Letrouitia transgressa]|nr:MAG: hypothetical protein LQ351_005393 [Letrouitia transgressa]
MEQRLSPLMSAQIHFIDAQLSLVHIPLAQYQHFLQVVLKLLFPVPADESEARVHGPGQSHPFSSWANEHPFFNVSITPIECSIVCSKSLAQELLSPAIDSFRRIANVRPDQATISSESFVVISVEGEGLEAGQRVLELTSPLALAGISIFFITTYFSDYILVPSRARGQVVRALEERGFQFEKGSEAYVNLSGHHHRSKSSTSSFDDKNPPTPPPTTVSELQSRTFALLKRHAIRPQVNSHIRLAHCAGRRDNPNSFLLDELGLQVGLVKCLIHQPRFLSLTLTQDEPASLLLEKQLLSNFGSENILLGSKDDFLVPIILDLDPLPLEATGIVCGVAGKLAGSTASEGLTDKIEMSYLSTVRAGTVMVDEKDLDRAIAALRTEEKNITTT